jgi:hypothetical protein
MFELTDKKNDFDIQNLNIYVRDFNLLKNTILKKCISQKSFL